MAHTQRLSRSLAKDFAVAPFKLEYCDGASWLFLASEKYVDNAISSSQSIQLIGDMTGTGKTGTPLTTILNPQINKSGNQAFSFSGTPDAFNFDLTIPNSTNKTVKLRLNRLNTGLGAGFEFQFYAPTNGVDTFTFGYDSGGQFGAYYTIANNAKVITFNSFRLAGLVDPVNATDAGTKGYIDTKIWDINSQTTGQLNIARLNGYPNNANLFLKGNGIWDYIAKSGSYYLIPSTGAFTDHVLLVNSVGKFGAGKYNAVCYGESGQAAAEFFYSSVLKSYINSSGTLTTASDRKLKNSLRKKDIWEKDYLQRILDLDVYSYTWKHKKSKSHDPHHVQIGLLYEDVAKLFNGNALSHPKLKEGFVCEDKHCPSCYSTINGIKPVEIMYYLILAFQSFYHKEYLPLKKAFSLTAEKNSGIKDRHRPPKNGSNF